MQSESVQWLQVMPIRGLCMENQLTGLELFFSCSGLDYFRKSIGCGGGLNVN